MSLTRVGWRGYERRSSGAADGERGTRHAGDLIQKDEAFDGVLTHPKILAAVYHVLRRSFKVLALGGRDPCPDTGSKGCTPIGIPGRRRPSRSASPRRSGYLTTS